MRISSALPSPPAIVPAPTASSVAPHAISTTATPEPQSAGRADATGGQIKPGNASQKTSLSQATLQNLPPELLVQIAGRTGPNEEGLNLTCDASVSR